MEGALEGDRIEVPVLQQNVVPLYIGPGIDSQAERKPKSEEQLSEKLHLGESGRRAKLKGIRDEAERGRLYL